MTEHICNFIYIYNQYIVLIYYRNTLCIYNSQIYPSNGKHKTSIQSHQKNLHLGFFCSWATKSYKPNRMINRLVVWQTKDQFPSTSVTSKIRSLRKNEKAQGIILSSFLWNIYNRKIEQVKPPTIQCPFMFPNGREMQQKCKWSSPIRAGKASKTAARHLAGGASGSTFTTAPRPSTFLSFVEDPCRSSHMQFFF